MRRIVFEPAGSPDNSLLADLDLLPPSLRAAVAIRPDVGWRESLRQADELADDAAVLHSDGDRSVMWDAFARLIPSGGTKAVASAADQPPHGYRSWLVRRALRAADYVIARTAAETARYLTLGVPADRLRRVPFAAVPPLPVDRPTLLRSLGLPDAARLIVAAGPLVRSADHACSVFAFNGLRYAVPDVWLVIAGDGPERQRLLDFARNAAFDDNRVRVTPPVPGLVSLAEQAWVTHRVGGVRVALEAMAAGVPVLAADTPDLREVVGDAGRFFPPGDRGRLCELGYRLLQDPPVAHALGEAGQRRAIEQFPPQRLADALAAVYHEAGVLPAS